MQNLQGLSQCVCTSVAASRALSAERVFKQDAGTELFKYRSAATPEHRLRLKSLYSVFFSALAAVSGHSERHQPESPVPSKRPSSRSETSENPLSSKRPRTAEKSSAEQVGGRRQRAPLPSDVPPKKTAEAQLPASH